MTGNVYLTRLRCGDNIADIYGGLARHSEEHSEEKMIGIKCDLDISRTF